MPEGEILKATHVKVSYIFETSHPRTNITQLIANLLLRYRP